MVEKNGRLSPEKFQLLFDGDFIAHARNPTRFAQDLYGSADPRYRIKTRVYNELAWHSDVHPRAADQARSAPSLLITFLTSPSYRCHAFKADPKRHGVRSGETIVAIDFTRRIILIGGTSCAGEDEEIGIHHAQLLSAGRGSVMPMHCSANVGPEGDVALFFGLSGTGKTTLSADPKRTLIGDDEHGWGPQGVFNFEGGCYAKCIKLSAEAEPEIYATTKRFGTVLENVVFDPDTRVCDFDDESKTENTRAAYPLEFIPNASRTGRAGMSGKNIDAADR